MQNIDIVFSIDENYIKHCATVIVSILKNTNTKKKIRFHIITEFISERNRNKLLKLKKIKDFDLFIYNISKEKVSEFPMYRDWISIACYYRILIPDILPPDIKKCLYLDCDLICLKDIEELWNYDIENYYLGAVKDIASEHYNKCLGFPKDHDYYNTGVMLLNLNKLREINLFDKCIKYCELHKDIVNAQDQDIINGVLCEQCLMLPLIWNICTPLYHNITKAYRNLDPSLKEEIYNNAGIVHFVNIYKPWVWYTKHPFKDAYWKYFALTPFKFEYFIHLVKKVLMFVVKFEKYQNGKKTKSLDFYLFNYNVLSYQKYNNIKEVKVFGIIKQKKTKRNQNK